MSRGPADLWGGFEASRRFDASCRSACRVGRNFLFDSAGDALFGVWITCDQSRLTNHFLSVPLHLPPTPAVLESQWKPPDNSRKTLYQKIWDSHVVREDPGQPSIIYIDRHLVHEGTSPQAFAGLRAEGLKVRRPDLTFAVMDHSVSTTDRTLPILDNDAKLQFDALEKNCRESGVRLFDMNGKNQGLVHIIGPE